MLLLTVFLLIILSIISYKLFDQDVFAPPTIVALGLMFSAMCALYNQEKWDLEFSRETTYIIVIGVTMFILGGILAVCLSNFGRLEKFGFSHKVIAVKPIRIENYKIFIILAIQLLTAVYLFFAIRRITGGAVWTEMVAAYRKGTGRLADLSSDEFILPVILRQLLDLNFSFALVFAYVIGNNISIKAKNSIWAWVSLLLGTAITFMRGYRSDMVRFWIAMLVVIYVQKKRMNGWTSGRDTNRLLRRMGYSFILVAIVFVVFRGTVGRKEMDWDPFYYFTFYAGSPIAALDLFIKEPFPPSDIWGKESFYNLNQSIRILFHKPELKYIFYKEFRRSRSGIYIGNIYTGLRAPYYDFGFKGLIIYMFLFGAFFTWLYLRLRKKRGKGSIDIDLLLYSYIAYTFFMYFYSTYNNFISHAFVKYIIILLFVRWFLIGWRVKTHEKILQAAELEQKKQSKVT